MTTTIEQLAKGQPDPSSLYVVPELTTLSVAFMADETKYVANQIFPSVDVPKEKGEYPVFPRGHFFRNDMAKRADGARSAGGGFAVTHQSFSCDVWAWHTKFGKKTRANAAPIDLDRVATMLCSNKAMINREVEFVTNYFGTGIWTTEIVGDATPTGDEVLTWMDDDAKPIKQLKAAIRQQAQLTGYKPNVGLFSADVWETFTEHPNVLARINQGQTPGGPAEVTRQMVANWLEIDRVLVAEGNYAPNDEGDTDEDDLDFVFPTGVLLAYAAPNPGIMVPSAGYQFNWTGYIGAGGMGQVMTRWFEQGPNANYYEIEQAYDQGMVSADLGTFFNSTILTPAS